MNTLSPVPQRGGRRYWNAGVFVAGIALGVWPLVAAPASPSAEGNRLTDVLPLIARLTVDLHGTFTPVAARPLTWRVSFSRGNGAERTGELSVTGVDFALRVAMELQLTTGELRWRVVDGYVDLAAWLPALATRPELSSMLAGLSATGRVIVAGEGTWSAGGVATGGLRLELINGTVRHATQGWSLDGVTLRAGGNAADLLKGGAVFKLNVATISTSRFGARALTVSGALSDFGRVAVDSARIEIAGGEVTAEPFAVSLDAPSLNANLVMKRVGLQDLVVFVPTALSEASGRINGKLRLGWNPQGGVQVGAGELSLDENEATTLRLISTPGFLTEQVPARFTLLPAWMGPLARWFSPANPGYDTLSKIERGKLGLRVDSLDVRLTPGGDEGGRSASVVIRARPEQSGTAVGELTIEVNVAGPLAAVLQMGMKQDFSTQMR